MKFGLPISIGLHGVFVAAGLVALGKGAVPLAQARVIPVEIINVSETTNIRAARKVPEPVEIEEPEITPPPEPEPEPLPEPEPVPEKLAEVKVPEVQDEVNDTPAEDTSEPTEPTEDTKPEDKEEPPKEPPKPKAFSIDELQKMADQAKAGAVDTSDQKLLTSEQNRIQQAELDRAAAGQGDGLSTSYEDAIMRKVYKAWKIPAGAPDMENLVVTVKVRLNRDGRVEDAVLASESRNRMRRDKFYAAAAESALRAVKEAQTFEFLPRDQYAKWRDINLTFYPKDIQAVVPI